MCVSRCTCSIVLCACVCTPWVGGGIVRCIGLSYLWGMENSTGNENMRVRSQLRFVVRRHRARGVAGPRLLFTQKHQITRVYCNGPQTWVLAVVPASHIGYFELSYSQLLNGNTLAVQNEMISPFLLPLPLNYGHRRTQFGWATSFGVRVVSRNKKCGKPTTSLEQANKSAIFGTSRRSVALNNRVSSEVKGLLACVFTHDLHSWRIIRHLQYLGTLTYWLQSYVEDWAFY